MNETDDKFVDLVRVVDEDDLTRIVQDVDERYQAPGQARTVARGIIDLRASGEPEDRQLAGQRLRDYLKMWLNDRHVPEEA